jgi:predicted DNA-binding transcriptional regulator YafY
MPQTLVQLETAIADQAALLIEYQSLGDYQPQYRRIQPYRLEQKDKLHYLYAYCYRAEADLTFRVDRISVIRDP